VCAYARACVRVFASASMFGCGWVGVSAREREEERGTEKELIAFFIKEHTHAHTHTHTHTHTGQRERERTFYSDQLVIDVETGILNK